MPVSMPFMVIFQGGLTDFVVNLMEFSEEIDISYEYLRHIVSVGGQKSLSFYSMYKIAKILGVSMDDLCDGIFDDNKLENKK